jgi:hypothetical protein
MIILGSLKQRRGISLCAEGRLTAAAAEDAAIFKIVKLLKKEEKIDSSVSWIPTETLPSLQKSQYG